MPLPDWPIRTQYEVVSAFGLPRTIIVIVAGLVRFNLDSDCLGNYRPVSNLSFLSKILERVVDARREEHLSNNNLHEAAQSAYKKSHSTETALLKVQSVLIMETHYHGYLLTLI